MNIFDRIVSAYSKKLPFTVYRKPGTTVLSGFFMESDDLDFTDNFSESGFVFSPFNSEEKSILFPIEKCYFIVEEFLINSSEFEEKDFKPDEKSYEHHTAIVKKAVDEIKNTSLKKVVISRKESVHLANFNLIDVFKKLLMSYENAFVSVWFHPKIGLWLGATPETLLQKQADNFKTMSLAGTQVYKSNTKVIWKSKELEEQQLVTDFIKNQLKEISSDLVIDKTETIKAGNLLHLRTRVEGQLNPNANLNLLIRALHPTPAVCGLPRNNAKKFILNNEGYNRRYYTGFLGELNINKKTSLFVNLRCMDITENTAHIYVGGGITKDSIENLEWQETVSKSKTMKKVL